MLHCYPRRLEQYGLKVVEKLQSKGNLEIIKTFKAESRRTPENIIGITGF